MLYNMPKQERINLIAKVDDLINANNPVTATIEFYKEIKNYGGVSLMDSKEFISNGSFDGFIETGVLNTQAEQKEAIMPSVLGKIANDLDNGETLRLKNVLMFCPLDILKNY